MSKYYRTQVQLRQDQYERLRRMAHTLSQQRGARVSISVRELLDRAFAEQEKWQKAHEAFEELFKLGEAVAARQQTQISVETWLSELREERANELYNTTFDRR